MNTKYFFLILIGGFLLACSGPATTQPGTQAEAGPARVKTGIEVLRAQQFAPLAGKKVGLVTNPTGVDAKLRSTVDILHQAREVDLKALYGPEHGVRGNFDAGDHVGTQTDPQTGLPMYSLYGKTRKPTPEMLESIDILVFDIQDIGCRSYTYISTLALVMEAAAENGREVMVLDRPNPLGGNKVEGTIWEKGFQSFVSQFDIPYVHGLTVGELAQMLNGENLLANGQQCELTVIPMEGWDRDMHFGATGLPWVPTSPHIPHAYSAFYYATTGIVGELNANMIGVGYTLPFQVLAMPWIDAPQLAKAMNNIGLDGVIFRPIWFRPYYKDLKGEELQGVQIHITNHKTIRPTEIQFHFLHTLQTLYPEQDLFAAHPNRHRMFDLVCGSDKIRKHFQAGGDMEGFLALWNKNKEAYQAKAENYYIY